MPPQNRAGPANLSEHATHSERGSYRKMISMPQVTMLTRNAKTPDGEHGPIPFIAEKFTAGSYAWWKHRWINPSSQSQNSCCCGDVHTARVPKAWRINPLALVSRHIISL